MDFRGFITKESETGIVIETIMPPELENDFFARIYARGSLNDAADGDAGIVWNSLKMQYGGRPLTAPSQVHGIDIIEPSDSEVLPNRPKADGIYVKRETLPLASLRFADCTPVIIAGVCEEPWLMIIHSGFKGTLQNFAGAAIDYALKKHPDQKLRDIYAWIGPAIGRECYSRKNDDPTTALAQKNFAPQNVSAADDLSFFDLKSEIAYRLSEAGVERNKIFVYDCCTYCRNDLFYSYRAGDDKKRIFLLAGSAKKSNIL